VTTKDERYRRLAVVEKAIGEQGWSLDLKRRLRKQFGVSRRTIDSYKADVIAGYRKQLTEEEWETQRSAFIGKLRGAQRVALEAGKLGPLASMLALEGRILGVDSPAQESAARIVLVAPEVKT